jgi:menaquinone-specific isochorismate synthase
MKTIALVPGNQRDFGALLKYLTHCRDLARRDGHFKIASISLEAKHVDPLAVLESIYEEDERHFYLENPVFGEAVASADAIMCASFSGGSRFAAVKDFAEEVLEHTITIGNLEERFMGPHFFCGFTFLENEGLGDFFAPATVFLPRWQVAHDQGRYSAVANLLVEQDSSLDPLAERVWAAHEKFSTFSYEAGNLPADTGERASLAMIGDGGVVGFERAVRAALTEIKEGRYEKIVLARALDLDNRLPFRPLEALNRLRNTYQRCHSFSFANGRGQSFIGSSPELLLSVDGKIVQTEALAGSAPRGRSARHDAQLGQWLLESEKNNREHRVVVESILRQLSMVGIKTQLPTDPQLLQLSNVQHLRSPITASLPPETHLLNIVAALHPTPAVGGVPRESAMSSIQRLEGFQRGLYAGALGWFDYRGCGRFIVAIRSALINGHRARVYAGNGIVKGSDPKEEVTETDLKLQALLKSLP